VNGRRDLLLAVGAAVLVIGATVSLTTVLEGGTWRPYVWVTLATAVAVAAVARAAGTGPGLAVLVSAAAWIAVTYAFHLEVDGLLPGREQAAEFVALWAEGIGDVIREPPPVLPRSGLLLLLATAAWWVGHLVHEIVVRARRPGVAILLVAVLWAFPLAVQETGGGRTWPHAVPFLAAAGLVLLLDPDLDLRRWHGATDRSHAPTAVGVTLGGAAIIVASVFPGALPGYGEEAWVDLTGAEGARGYQPLVDVTRRLQQPTPRDLLHIRSERPVYLRLAGLETFDGGTWRLGPADQRSFSPRDVVAADRPLPPEVEIREREMLTVEVENLGLENVFVPAPYHPLRIHGPAASRMVYSREGSFVATSDVLDDEPALVPGLTYTVEVAVPTPSAASLAEIGWEDLDDPAFDEWLALPTGYPALSDVAAEVRAQDGAESPFQVALALQSFFRDPDNFRYSTDVSPLRTDGGLERFVTEDRVGYCEYFATALAVMLRQEGIPARVAVGFRIGDRVEEDTYLVSSDHAHAWVEALFPGYGWIQFEPTPALPDTLVPSETIAAPDFPAGQAPTELGQVAPEDPLGDQLPAEQPPDVPDDPAAAPRTVPPLAVTIAGLLVLLVAVAVASYRWAGPHRRRSRPELEAPDRVLAAQRWLYEDARALGVGRAEHETAREVAVRWGQEGRVDPRSATDFADVSQAAAFGGDPGDAVRAERLATAVVTDLRESVPRRSQLLAPLRAPLLRAADIGRETLDTARERLRVGNGR
jgi:transglutaminase-like putative cysteine protease